MGANIGTSVTNTIVAMGQMGEGDQLERAFAGATVHDMFNFLTVAILLPLEVVSGYLYYLTKALVKNASTSDGDTRDGFVKKYIEPLGQLLIIVNKDVIKTVSKGGSCDDFYPIVCEDDSNPTKDTCSQIGLIGCPKGDAPCPSLFDPNGTQKTDEIAGLTAFLLGICILFICLYGLVTVLQGMLLGASTRIIYKATDINGYLAMILGCAITLAVQSSSITTSTLTPLVGMGLVRLEQMYPMTLGANIGTTITGIMSALVTEGTDALQVALAHLFFNVTGIVIWYPLPILRRVPIHAARQLGKATRAWKGFPILYIIFMFLLIPLGLLALSTMFASKKTSQVAIASILIALIMIFLIWFIWWWNWRQGRWLVGSYFQKRQLRVNAMETLPYDMAWIQRKIKEIQEHSECDAAQQPTLPAGIDDRAVFVNVAGDMEHATNMVKALIAHTGLPDDEKEEGDVDLGRFLHKEKEAMPDVDTSGYWMYQCFVLFVGVVCLALCLWGIGALIGNGSVGFRGMGFFLLALLLLFAIYRIYMFFFNDGKNRSLAEYKDRKLKKMCNATYTKTMAEITADLDKLAAHTNLPALTLKDVAEPGSIPAVITENGDDKGVKEEAAPEEETADA
jgi:solute carrier family 34 (sodium-dependent phosphate cotransporter)